MPRDAWKQILKRTFAAILRDNISLAAAGVAFYGFTALVPLLGAIVLSYGFLAEPATVVADMRHLTSVMPVDAAKLVGDQLMNVVKTSADKKGAGLLLALAIALYGVRSGAAAIITGLNIAYDEVEHRSFLKLTMLTIAVTAASVLVAVIALSAVAALGHLEDLLPPAPAIIGKFASYALLELAGAAGAATLYRYGPDRAKARWIWITPGSLCAAAGWLLLSILFGIYVANFGHYNATYGSLGTVIVFLTWLYLSSYVLLVGAELNAEVERQTRVDTTEGPPRPEGERGAAVADDSVEPSHPPASVIDRRRPTKTSAALTAIIASRIANSLSGRRAGTLSTIFAAAGVSTLGRRGRAALGIAFLTTGGLLAFLRRDDAGSGLESRRDPKAR